MGEAVLWSEGVSPENIYRRLWHSIKEVFCCKVCLNEYSGFIKDAEVSAISRIPCFYINAKNFEKYSPVKYFSFRIYPKNFQF